MPYLHYERRSDQARIDKVIKRIIRSVRQEEDMHYQDPSMAGNTSSLDDSDDNQSQHNRFNSRSRRQSSSSAPAQSSSQKNLQSSTMEGERQSSFLSAEEELITEYLYRQRPLHVGRSQRVIFMSVDYRAIGATNT